MACNVLGSILWYYVVKLVFFGILIMKRNINKVGLIVLFKNVILKQYITFRTFVTIRHLSFLTILFCQ